MECSRIPVLSRFDTISHIMPFYANTHKSFLLLSKLCSASRRKLDEYYDEFIAHMEKYRICLYINSTNIDTHLFLPNDLFTINRCIIWNSTFNVFTLFIENLSKLKGCYFNSHYMHSKIIIKGSIGFNSDLIKKLEPYLDILRSIQPKLLQLCQVISINDSSNFSFRLIPHFTDGDINQPDPHFGSFSRIKCIDMKRKFDEVRIKNLKMIDKASINIDSFMISNKTIEMMCELYQDKVVNLKVNYLSFYKQPGTEISNETVEVLNKINPNFIFIEFLNRSFDDIKQSFSFNSAQLMIYFKNYESLFFKIKLCNTKVLIFDYEINQKFFMHCNSIVFHIEKQGFKGMDILKADKNNRCDFDCIYIPFASVCQLEGFGFKTVSSSQELLSKLAHLDTKEQTKANGFVLPIKHLYQTDFILDDNVINRFNTNQAVTDEILKTNRLNCEVEFFDDILEIAQLLPNSFRRIDYSFDNCDSIHIARHSDIKALNEINIEQLRFSEIFIDHILSPEEYKFVCRLLTSDRTKFSLFKVRLYFNLLSESLNVLSLCADCLELNSIVLGYFNIDVKIDKEIIDKAVKEFKKKFKIINDFELTHLEN